MVFRIGLATVIFLLAASLLPAADCNKNGVQDDLEIRNGRARDCNRNGIPDECDLKAGALEFSDAGSHPISFSASVVMAVDLNGDDHPDLVTANPFSPYSWSGTLAVLLNNGAGEFGPAAVLPVGTAPKTAAISDLDADGDPDLVSANYGSKDLSVLLNGGSADFDQAVNTALDDRPVLLVAADFDGDRRGDLGVSLEKSTAISMLRGLGDGKFEEWRRIDLKTGPRALLEGDFDGDGRPDVAAAGGDPGWLTVLLNEGDGSFSAAQLDGVLRQATALATADFNMDGDLDLVAGSSEELDVWLFRNGGAGGLEPPIRLTSPPAFRLAPGDFDGDGFPDLAIVSPGSTRGRILLTDGLIRERPFSLYFSAQSISAADFQGDGNLDLAAAHGAGTLASLSIFSNISDANLEFQRLITETSPVLVLAADLDGDARADVTTANFGSASVMLSDRTGRPGPAMQYPANFGGFASIPFRNYQPFFETIDFDGDGDLDLLSGSLGDLSMLPNDGTGGFGGSTVHPGTQLVFFATAADIDGDGSLDLLLAFRGSNAVSVAFNNRNGTFADRVDFDTGGQPVFVEAADLDGDGREDLAAMTVGASQDIFVEHLSLHLNKGDGSFAAPDRTRISGLWSLTAADLNGDGREELISGRDFEDRFMVIHRLVSGSVLSYAFPGGTSDRVLATDLNADGLPDLVFSVPSRRMLSIIRNYGSYGNGVIAVNSPYLVATGEVPRSVAAGDFDGDGEVDLAAAGADVEQGMDGGGTVSLFLNRTPPASEDRDRDGVPDECRPRFHRGDPDGDGAAGLSDAVFLVNRLFLGGEAPGCEESADSDNDGRVDLSDAISVLNYLFLAGPPPADPGPPPTPCGADTDAPGAPGDLGCLSYHRC